MIGMGGLLSVQVVNNYAVCLFHAHRPKEVLSLSTQAQAQAHRDTHAHMHNKHTHTHTHAHNVRVYDASKILCSSLFSHVFCAICHILLIFYCLLDISTYVHMVNFHNAIVYR